MRGLIRFVGGPMHNKHLAVSDWALPMTCAVPRPAVSARWCSPSEVTVPDRLETVVYRCHKLMSPSRTMFFEYHACGSESQTEQSGNRDGAFPEVPQSIHEMYITRIVFASIGK